MSVSRNMRGAFATLGVVFWITAAPYALADVKDYQFELVQNDVKSGGEVTVAVRLINKKTGRPVPDAVIFAKRIDMAPDGMAEMKEPIKEIASIEPGVYRFKTNIPMAGRWQLSLGAKIQGETGTVESKLVVKATP